MNHWLISAAVLQAAVCDMDNTDKAHNTGLLDAYRENLKHELLCLLRERGCLGPGPLASSPDMETMWENVSKGFLADAVREFQGYPVVTLAWAGYLGMGVARMWDQNWDLCCQSGYVFYQGSRGFDDMDEHITQSILGLELDSPEANRLADILRSMAEMAHSFLRNAPVERGSADAYRAFLETVHIMYDLGAAMELTRMGYRMEPMS